MPKLIKFPILYIAVLCVFMFNALLFFTGCSKTGDSAKEWPTAHHDFKRSNVTNNELTLPLHEQWRYTAPAAPSPAWPAPAAQDYWHVVRKLTPAVTYDRAYHIAVSNGMLYFGSSTDDKIYALDTGSGRERWSFSTEGPVRLAPVVHKGRIYAGSDDGYLYCLKARNGSLEWKANPSGRDTRLPGNERIISLFPVRSGILIENDMVYCTAGLFPSYGTFLSAFDCSSGDIVWREQIDISAQGYMMASDQRLFVPTGRTRPAIYNANDGKHLGTLDGPGGCLAFASGSKTVNGPGRRDGDISIGDRDNPDNLLRFKGIRMVLRDNMAYIVSQEYLTAINHVLYLDLTKQLSTLSGTKKALEDSLAKSSDDSLQKEIADLTEHITKVTEERKTSIAWKIPCAHQYSLILAGNTLFAGGDDSVIVVDSESGEISGTLNTDGKAFSLAAAEDKLFVSTDMGIIHCYASGTRKTELVDASQHPETTSLDNDDKFAEAADRILTRTGITKGYCFDLGCVDGSLACALARKSDLQIACLTDNPKDAKKARKTIDKAGLNGRVTTHLTSLTELPYIHHIANLAVSESVLVRGKLKTPESEIERILRPGGGIACFGSASDDSWDTFTNDSKAGNNIVWHSDNGNGHWIHGKRRELPGIGEWNHLYANAANTSCSGDSLLGPMTVQWFGRPGPREMIDRHHRSMSPLYKNGRLFITADAKIITVDAYNGTKLWELNVPGSRRVGALKDCGHIVLADDILAIAVHDSCLAVDTSNGNLRRIWKAPSEGNYSGDWGYLSLQGNLCIGTVQKKGASFADLDFRGSQLNGSFLFEEDFREVVASESLFALDRDTGKAAWTYRRGKIMNSTITIADNCIYFAESRNSAMSRDEDGRIRIDHFCKNGMYIVALDLATGAKKWERRYAFPYEHIMFLSYSDGTLLFNGTYNKDGLVRYGLYAFNASDCKDKWETHFIGTNVAGTAPFGTNGSHGEQWQHPVIHDGTIYARPYAFNLATGTKLDYVAYRGGHGCGGMTGSVHYLFGRGSNPRMYPLDTAETSGIPLNTVSRPGCWLNMIPAGGLLLIPESSSGCTCAYPMQTSIAFSPAG